MKEKCAQYWPTQEEREMSFRDTRFVVTLVSEDVKSYYTTRVLELQNASVSASSWQLKIKLLTIHCFSFFVVVDAHSAFFFLNDW